MTVFLVDRNLFHNAHFLKLTRALHTSIFSVSWPATRVHDRQKNQPLENAGTDDGSKTCVKTMD
jgi:hypothetical protein